MSSSRYTDQELLALCTTFPSTCNILGDTWDVELLDQMGYEIWADLSESWFPGVQKSVPNILRTLDTIRYLLFLHNPQRQWKSGSFDAHRVLEKVWDTEHINIYNEWKTSSQ